MAEHVDVLVRILSFMQPHSSPSEYKLYLSLADTTLQY